MRWALASAQSPGNGETDSCFTAPSGFLTQWAVRLIRHSLPLVRPWWLFPTTLFPVCRNMEDSLDDFSRDWRESDWNVVSWIVLLAFLKMGTVFAFLQLLAVSPALHNLSNMIKSSLARTTAISSCSLGCSPCVGHSLKQTLLWSSSTVGCSSPPSALSLSMKDPVGEDWSKESN